MSTPTTTYALQKGVDADNAEVYLATTLPATLDIIDAQMLNSWQRLAELGGAAASYDFTAIPQTFRHLMLVTYGRSDTAALSTGLRMRLANISTATYYWQRLLGSGATASAAEALAETSAAVGIITGATAAAALMGTASVLIPHYTQTNREKPFTASSTVVTGLTTGLVQITQFGGLLDATGAIDRVTLFPLAGSFVADSIATLYGLPR